MIEEFELIHHGDKVSHPKEEHHQLGVPFCLQLVRQQFRLLMVVIPTFGDGSS